MTSCVERNPDAPGQQLIQKQEEALLAAFRKLSPRERVKLIRMARLRRSWGEIK